MRSQLLTGTKEISQVFRKWCESANRAAPPVRPRRGSPERAAAAASCSRHVRERPRYAAPRSRSNNLPCALTLPSTLAHSLGQPPAARGSPQQQHGGSPNRRPWNQHEKSPSPGAQELGQPRHQPNRHYGESKSQTELN
jgi:hypothetical protein